MRGEMSDWELIADLGRKGEVVEEDWANEEEVLAPAPAPATGTAEPRPSVVVSSKVRYWSRKSS